MRETVVVYMQTPPMMFWQYLSAKEWQSLSREYQQRLINAAKYKLCI